MNMHELANITCDTKSAFFIDLKFARRTRLARSLIIQFLEFSFDACDAGITALKLSRAANVAKSWTCVTTLLASPLCTGWARFAFCLSSLVLICEIRALEASSILLKRAEATLDARPCTCAVNTPAGK